MAQIKIKGILSYPHLFQARSVQPGDDPKFSVTVLLKKGDPQIATVQAVIDACKLNGFPAGFPATGKVFMKDGDETGKHPGYMMVQANCRADQRPIVVDSNLQPVTDPSQVYAGAIAWASLNTSNYNMPVNKGVGCYINGVMVTGEEGELGRIDGRPTVDGMFGDLDAPPPAPPQAPPPAPPQTPAPAYQMTEAANGVTRDAYIAAGWTDEQLILNGMMSDPVSFSKS